MKVRVTLIVGLLVITAVGLLMLLATRPVPAADGPRPPAAEVARYQAFSGMRGPEYLLDTATGQVWYAQNMADKTEWTELVSPPKKKQ
jgi:hypothetical protein